MTPINWKPSATLQQRQQRAALLAKVRAFFCARAVLEIETPLLCRYSVSDPHMDAISADNPVDDHGSRYFLQTSPEYAMKRLLAAGSGPIFQICKAFRRGEQGSRHNPEFTLLEWYRPGFDHWQLMDEVADLLCLLLPCESVEKKSYRQLFLEHLGIDVHACSCQELQELARAKVDIQMESDNSDDWLNLLMAECIEPSLGQQRPLFVYDYPASQSALAKIGLDENNVEVAQRFEVYAGGVELANGYHELIDADEQRRRIDSDRQQRKAQGCPDRAGDQYLLAAMDAGLPACAGVALGLDRLLMIVSGVGSIIEVVSFPVDRS